jgi:hypothetical protein
MPLRLGHYSPRSIPTLDLMGEVVIGDDRLPGWPLSRRYQQVRDCPLQHFVGGQPDGVADLSGLPVVVKFRLGESGIGSEQ